MTRVSKKIHEKISRWDAYESAAKTKYGNDIRVIKSPWATKQVQELRFEVTVVQSDPEPLEKARTTSDINMKEYINYSEKDNDETLVRVTKKKIRSLDNRYMFSTTKGVHWDVGGNIGAQVMGLGLSMVGISAGISGNYGKQKSTTTEKEKSESESSEYCYEQEEKIVVPAMTKVNARITTYAMKYEQGYTLKLSLPKKFTLRVLYKTRLNQIFCGSILGTLTSANLLHGLPGYEEEDDEVSILQDGTLAWVGEGSKIDKLVQPL